MRTSGRKTLHHAKKRTRSRTVVTQAAARTADAVKDRPTENQRAIDVLRQWLADDSGYDERVWPEVKKSIEEHRLGRRKRFAP
jgi:hypothetical protein